MSKQLAITTKASVLAMAAFALFAQPAASQPAAWLSTQYTPALPAPLSLAQAHGAILPR